VAIFHSFFILSTVTSTLIVLNRNVSVKIRLIVIILWTMALRLATPLRLPDSILTNGPDSWYLKQIVDQIISSGLISMNYGTGEALAYSFYPVTQLLYSMCLIVIGIEQVTFMKFVGSFLSIPFVVIIFYLFRRFAPQDESLLATQITASCFWFIYFGSLPVQSTFGTFFAAVLLLGLTGRTNPWKSIFVVGCVALALSHFLTAFYVIVMLVAAKSFMLVEEHVWKRASLLPLTLSSLSLFVGVAVGWLLFAALVFSRQLVEIAAIVYGEIIQPNVQFALYQESSTLNPPATRVLGDIGIVTYGLLLVVGFLYIGLRQNRLPIAGLIPYAFGSGAVFGVNTLIFSLGIPFARDVLARGFMFTFLIGSPLVVFVLNSKFSGSATTPHDPNVSQPVRSKMPLDDRTTQGQIHGKRRLRAFWIYLAIFLILLSSMYYYYPAYRYDNSAPLSVEDYRLPLEQWRVVAGWASSHIGAMAIHGDDLAFDFIGAIAHKQVQRFPAQTDLLEWINSDYLKGAIIVVRVSVVQAHYPSQTITNEQLESFLSSNNVVYNGGDPVIIIRLDSS
jgi:hypothetical protein